MPRLCCSTAASKRADALSARLAEVEQIAKRDALRHGARGGSSHHKLMTSTHRAAPDEAFGGETPVHRAADMPASLVEAALSAAGARGGDSPFIILSTADLLAHSASANAAPPAEEVRAEQRPPSSNTSPAHPPQPIAQSPHPSEDEGIGQFAAFPSPSFHEHDSEP